MAPAGRVVVVVDETTRGHVTPPFHPERIERVDAVVDALTGADGVQWRSGRPATGDELELVHTAEHVAAMRDVSARGGGALDPDTYASEGTFDAALGAAGSGLVALDAMVADTTLDAAFVLTRPPGHHATRERALGFCFFNNVAIAAARLVAAGERVLIVDWDVHHGNGTQDIFWSSPDVMYVSIHEEDVFPGTGGDAEIGEGDGRYHTMNLPLPSGATGDVYVRLVDDVVAPVVRRFRPSWVLVSAGFDAHAADPLAGMALREQDYALLTDRVHRLAPTRGRTLLFLEGGYDLNALGASARTVVDTLVHGLPAGTEPTTGGRGLDRIERFSDRWPA